jgi:hypothetical protein
MTRRKALKDMEHKVGLDFRTKMKEFGIDLQKKDERSLVQTMMKLAKQNPKFRHKNGV